MAKVRLHDSTYEGMTTRGNTVVSLRDSNPSYWKEMGAQRRRIHDSNFVFLKNELSKLDPTVYKPKLFITYAEDIDIVEGGGLVDYVNYFTTDWTGIADEINNLFGNQANYVPRVNAGLTQEALKVFTFEIAYDLRFVDLEKMNKVSLPQSIESMYKDAVLAGFDLFANRIAYLGVGGNGGLFTSDKVKVHSFAGAPEDFEDGTDAEVLALLNGILAVYLDEDHYNLDLLPNMMLVPTVVGKNLSSRTSELYAQSLRNYFLKNNIAVDEALAHDINNFKLTIKTRPQLNNLGVNGVGRIVVYKKNPEFVKLHIPYAIQQFHTGPNMDKFAYTTLFVGQVSEIQLPYNPNDAEFGAVNYFDLAENGN